MVRIARKQKFGQEQLSAIARSEHGVVLQLIARYRAIDEGDTAAAEQLDRIIREGVDTIALALGAPLTAPETQASVRVD